VRVITTTLTHAPQWRRVVEGPVQPHPGKVGRGFELRDVDLPAATPNLSME
jgi:hypothetical protein